MREFIMGNKKITIVDNNILPDFTEDTNYLSEILKRMQQEWGQTEITISKVLEKLTVL